MNATRPPIELYVEKRGDDRLPDHFKVPRSRECALSLCAVVPGEPTTRCCERIVIPRYAQTVKHLSQVDALQPVAGDFGPEPIGYRVRREA